MSICKFWTVRTRKRWLLRDNLTGQWLKNKEVYSTSLWISFLNQASDKFLKKPRRRHHAAHLVWLTNPQRQQTLCQLKQHKVYYVEIRIKINIKNYVYISLLCVFILFLHRNALWSCFFPETREVKPTV